MRASWQSAVCAAVFWMLAAVEVRAGAYLDDALSRIDLNYEPIRPFVALMERGDEDAAFEWFSAYYDGRELSSAFQPAEIHTTFTDKEVADRALLDEFYIQGQWGAQLRHKNGMYDWDFKGPVNDQEWAWMFNRHITLRFIYDAFLEEGEEVYREFIEAMLDDWIDSNPAPQHMTLGSAWRALEAARRIDGVWLKLYFSKHLAMSGELRLKMFNSLHDHGRYLRYHHSFYGNHVITEMMSLLMISLAFPEFKDSEEWKRFACEKIRAELFKQTYADGAYKELANHYQKIVLDNYTRVLRLLREAGDVEGVSEISDRVELMWDYWAYVSRPNGSGPLNNDSDLEANVKHLAEGLELFDRPDWEWIVSGGERGELPAAVPARYFEWAGHAVMRNGWTEDAHWAFFDMGPYGSDHQHDDRMHLSVSLGRRDFLVDSGRYTYKPGAYRDYFQGPRSHNVLIIDGQRALRPPDSVESPLPVTALKDRYRAFFEAEQLFEGSWLKGKGSIRHRRAVAYASGRYWVVRDSLDLFGSHEVEVFWHFHPDCKVQREGEFAVRTSFVDGYNLAIIPMLPKGWVRELHEGVEEPEVQGWYSNDYNVKQPSVVAEYSGEVRSPLSLYWLILPLKEGDLLATRSEEIAMIKERIQKMQLEDFESIVDSAGGD